MGIGLARMAIVGIGAVAIVAVIAIHEWTPPMSPEARAALDEAAFVDEAVDAAREAMAEYPSEIAPYLPGPPSEYRTALAAGRDSILANEAYARSLRAAAADGEITQQEQAAMNAARLRAEAAADAEYQAWIDTPIGDLVELQSDMWEHVGNAMAADGEERGGP